MPLPAGQTKARPPNREPGLTRIPPGRPGRRLRTTPNYSGDWPKIAMLDECPGDTFLSG